MVARGDAWTTSAAVHRVLLQTSQLLGIHPWRLMVCVLARELLHVSNLYVLLSRQSASCSSHAPCLSVSSTAGRSSERVKLLCIDARIVRTLSTGAGSMCCMAGRDHQLPNNTCRGNTACLPTTSVVACTAGDCLLTKSKCESGTARNTKDVLTLRALFRYTAQRKLR